MKIFQNNRKIIALIKKEIIEIKREKSAIFIAILMPVLLTLIFGFAVSFDFSAAKIGVVIEGEKNKNITDLIDSINGSRYLEIKKIIYNRKNIANIMNKDGVNNILIIPEDFDNKIATNKLAAIEIISDASEPNGSKITTSYISQAFNLWLKRYNAEHGINSNTLDIKTRFWYNSELNSNYTISIGSIVMTIAVVGTLLTALVVSKEWEMGTMEQVMATSVSMKEINIAKMITYFVICVCSFLISFALSKVLFAFPMRGSIFLYFIANMLFCLLCISAGLLVSIAAKNQFIASQISFLISFLPTMLMSGLIFDINSMPKVVQMITYIFPSRYILELSMHIALIGNDFIIYTKNIIIIVIFELILLHLIKNKSIKKL